MIYREKKQRSKMLLAVLKKRSRNGLEFAKKAMLTEKIESEKLRDALEYYVSNWEIFPHPALLSIACDAVGGSPDNTVKVQAAIAMLSAALDIHDDIIDKSDTKHGRPTVFGKFGQDLALVLGDVFFVTGFTLLGKSTTDVRREKAMELFETIERCLLELGSAHALESNLKGRISVSPEQYMRILEMKAASIETDMRIGAVIGGGTASEIEALTKYGRILGALATLREEFIDIFDTQEMRQRTQNGCLPIPILYALQSQNSTRIQKIILKKTITNRDIDRLLDIVFEMKETKKLKRKMRDAIKNALRLTAQIRNEKIRPLLQDLAISSLEDL
jgi:geranylgeranyl pyrophosphate synthase